MGYRLSRKAADDLRHIYAEGLRLFGDEQAARYHAHLEAALATIADNPKLARERPELGPPARVHPVGSHVVLYVEDEAGGVLIVRVRHGREDWIGSS